jgi:hypothetical protein
MNGYELFIVKVHQNQIANEVDKARQVKNLRRNRRSTSLAKRLRSILTAVK